MIRMTAVIAGALWALSAGSTAAADIASALVATPWCATPKSVFPGYANNPHLGQLSGGRIIGATIRFHPAGPDPYNIIRTRYSVENVVQKPDGTTIRSLGVSASNSWSLYDASNLGALAYVSLTAMSGLEGHYYVVNGAQGHLQLQNQPPMDPRCLSSGCDPPPRVPDQVFVPCR